MTAMPNDDFVVIMDDDAFAALDLPPQRATPSIIQASPHHHCRVVISDAGLVRRVQRVQQAQHARSPPCAA